MSELTLIFSGAAAAEDEPAPCLGVPGFDMVWDSGDGSFTSLGCSKELRDTQAWLERGSIRRTAALEDGNRNRMRIGRNRVSERMRNLRTPGDDWENWLIMGKCYAIAIAGVKSRAFPRRNEAERNGEQNKLMMSEMAKWNRLLPTRSPSTVVSLALAVMLPGKKRRLGVGQVLKCCRRAVCWEGVAQSVARWLPTNYALRNSTPNWVLCWKVLNLYHIYITFRYCVSGPLTLYASIVVSGIFNALRLLKICI